MRESTLERALREYVKRCGGRAYKFISPGNPGVPDRLCVFPGGLVVFVELKRPDVKDGLSVQQRKTMNYLLSKGCIAWKINNLKDFKEQLYWLGVHP